MNGNIVTITTFREYTGAFFLKNQLEAEGIETYLSYESLPGRNKDETIAGVKVRVKAMDVEKAIRIMFRLHEEYGPGGTPEKEKIRSYRKILVPVDFSPGCISAFRVALGLAKNIHGEIMLVHVYEDPLELTERVKETASFEKYREEVRLHFEEKARADMERFTAGLKEQLQADEITKARFHYRLLHGDFAVEVIREAEDYRPEIILLGNCGSSSPEGRLDEGAGLSIIRNSRFPVLVVPEKSEYQPEKEVRVVYATDFLDNDYSSLRQLLAILSLFRVHIYCVHVEASENLEISQSKMDELNAHVAAHYSQHHIEFHLIRHEDFIRGLHEFAHSVGAEIISFTSPKRSMIYKLLNPDNLKRVIRESRLPLLIFREGRKL